MKVVNNLGVFLLNTSDFVLRSSQVAHHTHTTHTVSA